MLGFGTISTILLNSMQVALSFFNNQMVGVALAPEAFKFDIKGCGQYKTPNMGAPSAHSADAGGCARSARFWQVYMNTNQ